MTKRLVWITGTIIFMLAGCAALNEQSKDPNSPMSGAVGALDTAAKSIQQIAPAAGPYGWIVGALATVVTGAAGVYKVRQKNDTISTDGRVITAQQREFNAIRDTTRAIVNAIEEVGLTKMPDGSTIGLAIKAQVAAELEKSKITTMGKAIISGIKAAKNEAQKM